jgi:uncharacterized phage infection (PIP) family protein YhgE
MSAQRNRRGAVAGIIAAVIVLLLVAVGIWYFVSKPFQTHVNQAVEGATQWTPENIRKDPSGYLTWAIAEVGKTQDKLKTAQLALTTQKIEISKKLDQRSTEMAQCDTLMKELKDAYNTASAKNDWPVAVGHHKFADEGELKRKIVEASHYLENSKKLVDTYTQAKGKVGDRLDEIDGQLTKVEDLRTKLATDLETAKVQQTFEGIDGISSDFTKIVNNSEALAQTAERNTSVSDMLKPSGDARIDDEFEKIMGKKKGAGTAEKGASTGK